MKLNELQPNAGSHKRKMRVGRGIGSGKGKTAGRGYKGQKSRTGVRVNGFEGGQMPIHRRLPKRGFTNIHRIEYATLSLGDLQKHIDSGKLDAGKPITVDVLREAGVVRNREGGVKLLATGKLTSKVKLEVSKASKGALEAVKQAGGNVTLPEPMPARVRSQDAKKKA